MSARVSFEQRFGRDQADAIVAAAEFHENGVNSENRGSDPFKWALLICLGYQCIEIESYRNNHEITAPWDEVRQWIKDNAHLESHDGDCDYLSLAVGAYDEYMPQEAVS